MTQSHERNWEVRTVGTKEIKYFYKELYRRNITPLNVGPPHRQIIEGSTTQGTTDPGKEKQKRDSRTET